MTTDVNLYDLLEVSPNASTDVIFAAYRSLMKRHHPDRNSGDVDAEERTKLLNAAVEVLKDPALRSAYDARLSSVPRRASHGASHASPVTAGSAARQRRRPDAHAKSQELVEVCPFCHTLNRFSRSECRRCSRKLPDVF